MVKKRKTSPILVLALVLLAIAIILGIYTNAPAIQDKSCITDEDCIVFGETGDCNCGCFNKDYQAWTPGGKCFCAAPISCKCVNGICEGVFEVSSFEDCVKAGNPIMESYPPKCKHGDEIFVEDSCQYEKDENIFVLTISDAKKIAFDSECGDKFKDTYICNEFTGTYWIDLDIEKTGCNPACVVNVETREAEVNWRCTGLIE